MSMYVYGASVAQENRNESDFRYDVLAKDSEVFAVGDPVTIASNVLKVVAASTDPIVGVCQRAYTAAQVGTDNDTVYPPFVPATQDTVFLMGTNSDLTDNETDCGKFFGLTGSTGAVLVNVSGGVTTTTSRQVVIVKVDPFKLGGSGAGSGKRIVLVKFFQTPYQNYGANT